jgi:homocitrate synthase NifV
MEDDLEDDLEDYSSVPLLIDVTLPVHHGRAPELVKRHSQRWRGLMAGIGVHKVKLSTAKVFSTDAVSGLDRAMLGDFASLFARLRALELPEIIFGNRLGLATAAAAAWLELGGRGVCASMGGAGGLPALEELRLMLHTSGRMPLLKEQGNFQRLREMAELFSGERTLSSKPVTGRAIFAVESGVHVDGLMKDPLLYEPYPPGLVGGRRLLSVGLHSGRGSIRLKCCRLGLPFGGDILEALGERVHALSLELGRGLTDEEFVGLHSDAMQSRAGEPPHPEASGGSSDGSTNGSSDGSSNGSSSGSSNGSSAGASGAAGGPSGPCAPSGPVDPPDPMEGLEGGTKGSSLGGSLA